MGKRKITRRSFVATVVGGAAVGSLAVIIPAEAEAHQGCSDSDPVNGGDPGGRGRRCASQPQTGCSDRDPTDAGGRGVNCRQSCSDRDPTDPSQQGRNCGGAQGNVPCSQCSCPSYVATPGNQFARCARESCGHSANYHFAE